MPIVPVSGVLSETGIFLLTNLEFFTTIEPTSYMTDG